LSGQFGEELKHLRPADLPTNHYFTNGINAVHLEHRLGDIQTDRNNLTHGHLLLLRRNLPLPRGWRAVHSIKSGLWGRSGNWTND